LSPFIRRRLAHISLSLSLSLAWSLLPGDALANPYNVGEVPKLISAREAPKLAGLGIHMTDQLLGRATTAADRRRLAKSTGLRAARVEQLARYADLLRLQNIGPEFVILLEATGVRSVPDLATRDAPALTKKAAALNRTRRIANPAPTEAQVADWISQSINLPAVLVPG
jgi:hypothetical protein